MASGSLNEDPGLFGPHSILWRVNRESAVTLAGTCAILMQFGHPKVAAGVRDHSRYQVDAAGRLRRTLDLTLAIVFGPRRAAMQAVRAINSIHRTVRGPGYSAMDPELLLWVHATLVYSAVRGYRRWLGRSPMLRQISTTRTPRKSACCSAFHGRCILPAWRRSTRT